MSDLRPARAARPRPGGSTADEPPTEPRQVVRVGFVVAPGLARDVTQRIADQLAEDLRASF